MIRSSARIGFAFILTASLAAAQGPRPRPRPADAAPQSTSRSSAQDRTDRSRDQQNENENASDAPAAPPSAPQQPAAAPDKAIQLSGNPLQYEVVGGRLVLSGDEADLDVLQEFLLSLQVAGARPSIGFVTLQNARATEMAQRVQQIFKSVHPTEDITVVGDEGSNSLIIAAPEAVFAEIKMLALNLDAETPPLKIEFEVIELKHIAPSEAATLLKPLLEQAVKRFPSGPKMLEKIQITPNDRNSTLTITAPKAYLDQIKELIAVYDVEPQGLAEAELLYIPLLNANAAKLADSLKQMLEVQGEQAEELKQKILRLRMTRVGPDGEIEQLPELDLEKPVKIVAEENTNSLIIATHDQNAAPLREIVRLLDSVPIAPEMGIEFYPLKYGDAEVVVGVLMELFDAGKSLPDVPGDKVPDAVPEGIPGKALVYNVAIHADKRTNTVVIAGRPEQVALAHTVINQLDVEGRTFFPKAQFLYLEHTDPERVANVLTQLNEAAVAGLEARGAGAAAIEKEKAVVVPELRANALVILATEDKFREMSELALKLDQIPEGYRSEIRIITCTNISAASLVSKVEALWERKRQLAERQEIPPDMPVVVADERSNALVIGSSVEDYEAIKHLVEDLEAQPLAPLAQIRLLEVKNNDAAQLATMLEQVFQARLEQVPTEEGNESERVALTSDAATNILLVASSPNNFEEIKRIVAALDVIPDLEGVVQTFRLDVADAANVESKIRDLVITQGLYQPGAIGADSPISEERNKIAMIADSRSNSIMVSASKPNMAIIEQLIKEMDRTDVMDFGAARIFKLEYADAPKVSEILKQVFDGLEQSIPQGSQEVFVKPSFIPVEGSNALIVTSSRDAMARTEDLLSDLDQPSTSPSSKFEVYTLKHASAIKLAPKIEEMFEAREAGAAEGERTPMHIQAVEGTNSLLVSASAEDHSVLKGLVDLLDIRSSLNQQLRIFNLKNSPAEETATVLNELFQREGDTGPANAIAVQPVPWTHSILVWATEGQMEDIEQMIAQLDENRPSHELRLETIQLKQAMATELAEAINKAISGETEGGAAGDARSAMIFSFFTELPDGQRELRKLLRQDITVIPYQQTNTLLVMAPPDSADMLISLIQRLDQLPPITADIQVFKLINADVEQVIETLEKLFEGTTETGAEEMDVTLTAPGAPPPAPGAPPGEGAGLRYPMTFAPDLRTNSVIAAGNKEYLKLVGKLIADLDAQAEDQRIIEFVHLNSSTAEDVSQRVKDFNDQERERLAELEEGVSPYMKAQEALTVVSDERTNSVFLGMSPKLRDQYLTLVKDLDRAPEQVLIEFMLVEVSLDDLFELGMEFTVQDLAFSEKAVQGPNNTIKGPNKDVVVGTSLGAAGSGGGFTFTITGEDFSFLFHALQTAGRAQLISRPSIVAEDNAEDARIAILNSVPTLRSVGADNAGNSITQVEYVDAGIDLQVTPHINPDGFIQLELDSQVTSVGPQVLVGGTSSVSIQGTELTTTVTVKDGETVIIGGLIESNTRDNEQKVPLLGDLPVVGQVFRTNFDQNQRRELLVVITATVIRTQEDAHRLSIQQRDQTDIVPESFKRSPLMGDLQVVPQVGKPLEVQDREMLKKPEDEPEGNVYGPQPTHIYGPVLRNGNGHGQNPAVFSQPAQDQKRIKVNY
jgi:type II secretion system protein D